MRLLRIGVSEVRGKKPNGTTTSASAVTEMAIEQLATKSGGNSTALGGEIVYLRAAAEGSVEVASATAELVRVFLIFFEHPVEGKRERESYGRIWWLGLFF